MDKNNPNAIADQASPTSVEACIQKLLEENETLRKEINDIKRSMHCAESPINEQYVSGNQSVKVLDAHQGTIDHFIRDIVEQQKAVLNRPCERAAYQQQIVSSNNAAAEEKSQFGIRSNYLRAKIGKYRCECILDTGVKQLSFLLLW